MKLLSASSLNLASRCLHPWTTSQPWPEREDSDASAHGTAVHRAIELRLTTGCWEMGSHDSVRAVARHAVELIESVATKEAFQAELPFALDPRSGEARRLPSRGARDYSDARRGELVGTADLVVVSPGSILVRDWKTGRQEHAQPAAEHAQLRFLALAAARVHGATRARVEAVYLSEEGARVDGADFDELDLLEIESELRDLAERLVHPSPPVPGRHCHDLYCPIRATCPATTSALAQVDPQMSLEVRDGEHAVWLIHRAKVARDAIEAIEKAAKAKVRALGGVTLPDGRTYGIREESRETIELGREGAYGVLVARLGEDRAAQAVELKATKTSLARVANAAEVRGVVEDLRALGAVRVTHFEKLEVSKAPKGKENAA